MTPTYTAKDGTVFYNETAVQPEQHSKLLTDHRREANIFWEGGDFEAFDQMVALHASLVVAMAAAQACVDQARRAA